MPSHPDRRVVAAVAGALAALVVGAFGWRLTLVGEYSVTPHAHTAHSGGRTSVTALTADPIRDADVRVTLVARAERVAIVGGGTVDGYTVNGLSPGPTVRARQGDLVEVEFVNESVTEGATLHWHGVDVPNAADGVAGITQDAVPPGGRHTYRFVAEDAGTYWYHSHQLSHVQVERGLFGAVVVEPASGIAEPMDALAVLHVYDGQHTLNGAARDEHVTAAPGQAVRVRVVNTDAGTASVWSAAPMVIRAVDGTDLHEPTAVVGQAVLVPAGGRVDVTVSAPMVGAVALHTGGARVVHIGEPGASGTPNAKPRATVDLLTYGSPTPVGPAAEAPDRAFDYVIGRRFGFLGGRFGQFWTVNGRMFPDMEMFHVAEGDVVRMRIRNDSGEVHPMHLHGHHALVLSRDGVPATGSPWWVDSLDVFPRQEYEIAFVADNPGIWSDHCHTLQHAVDGLIAHVMYEGVTTPFTIHGPAGNAPE